MKKMNLFNRGGLLVVASLMGLWLFNACTKERANRVDIQAQAQMAAASKWLNVLSQTTVTPPTEKDRVVPYQVAVANVWGEGGIGGGIYDSFPSAPGINRGENIDDQYTSDYIRKLEIELTPLVEQSEDYLASFGFTIRDFMREGVEYDPTIIIHTAMAVQGAVEKEQMDLSDFGVTSADIGWVDVENCLKKVFEWDMFMAILNGQTGGLAKHFDEAARRTLIRIVGKTVTRCIGWVGAAMTVYELTSCLMAENESLLNNRQRWISLEFRQGRLS